MDLTLRSDDGPLYEQIARSVRAAVASGELSRGDRLPSARDLADGLGVSYHTVLQAFEVLAAEGVIDVRRGRGVLVAAAPGPVVADPAILPFRHLRPGLRLRPGDNRRVG